MSILRLYEAPAVHTHLACLPPRCRALWPNLHDRGSTGQRLLSLRDSSGGSQIVFNQGTTRLRWVEGSRADVFALRKRQFRVGTGVAESARRTKMMLQKDLFLPRYSRAPVPFAWQSHQTRFAPDLDAFRVGVPFGCEPRNDRCRCVWHTLFSARSGESCEHEGGTHVVGGSADVARLGLVSHFFSLREPARAERAAVGVETC